MSRIDFSMEPVDLERTGAVWTRLEQDGGGSFFISWSWIGTWLACLPERVTPFLLTAVRGNEIIGAAIVVRKSERQRLLSRDQLHFNATGDPEFDCITIERNGFIAHNDVQAEIWPAFLSWFARESIADELHVPGMVEGAIATSPGSAPLVEFASRAPAYLWKLPGDGRDVVNRLSRNARHQLKRSMRKCRALGELRCETANSQDIALGWFERLKALHIESWTARAKPHAFRFPFFEKFHRALISRCAVSQKIELMRISAGTNELGFLYNFRSPETILAYQSGFDVKCGGLRPGYVSHALAIAGAENRDVSYDFLAGENRLKRTFANHDYAMCSYRFAKPGLVARLEAFAKSFAAAPPVS